MEGNDDIKLNRGSLPITSSSRNKDASIGFFFGDETDDCRDGNDLRSPGEPLVGFHSVPDHSRSSRAYFSCSERMRYGRTDGPRDGPTDRPTDRRTKPHIEMLGRI